MNSMGRRPARNGEEQDVFFAPEFYAFNHGARNKVKTRARRRDRRGTVQELRHMTRTGQYDT